VGPRFPNRSASARRLFDKDARAAPGTRPPLRGFRLSALVEKSGQRWDAAAQQAENFPRPAVVSASKGGGGRILGRACFKPAWGFKKNKRGARTRREAELADCGRAFAGGHRRSFNIGKKNRGDSRMEPPGLRARGLRGAARPPPRDTSSSTLVVGRNLPARACAIWPGSPPRFRGRWMRPGASGARTGRRRGEPPFAGHE